VEYTFAVWAATTLMRYLFTNIDRVIHPKWLTLFMGFVIGLVIYVLKIYADEQFMFIKAVCSFALATVGYDYIGKPLWDKVTGKNAFEAKSTRR
jgi:hypothetical protein